MKCPECHEEIAIGDWPYCPHGPAKSLAVHGDEIDYIDHNLGQKPIHIRSKAERRRLMRAAGLEEAVRHVPHPKGPEYCETTDWGSRMDPQTAKNVKELLERAFKVAKPEEEDEKPLVDLDIRDLTPEEAEAYLP